MADVEIKERPACKLAYIEHVGDYGKIPYDKYIAQLYAWVKEKKIMPGFYPMGIFFDCPETTPSEKCRSEIAITIKGDAKPGKDIKIRNMPVMTVAVIRHKAPAKDYPKTYQRLAEWIAKNGYEWAGPPIEVYTRKPKVVGGETILYANIQVPVRKK